MNPFRDWLRREVAAIGWTDLCRRGGFTSGALQGWLRGAFPGPQYQERLALATKTDLDVIRLLVWESEKLRLAPEVPAAPNRFRRGPRASGGAAQARRPRQQAPTDGGSARSRPRRAGGTRPITRPTGRILFDWLEAA